MRIASVAIMTEGDAVDLHDFEGTPPRAETRGSLRVSEKTPLIAYVGQLEVDGLSRGIPELLKTCEILRMRGRVFHLAIAGGPDFAVRRFQHMVPEELRSSITFLGRIPHMKVPTLLKAADILVYPAPDVTDDFYRRDVSPLTLFEYMASGIPIVSADLVPLHDVISPAMVTLVPPGDPTRLADGVEYLLDHPEDAAKQAAIARSHVAECTWLRRMQRIMESAQFSR